MIEMLKKNGNKIEEAQNDDKYVWINVINPQESEIVTLKKRFNVPDDFFTDPLDPDETPRMEFDDENFLIIFKVPILLKEYKYTPFETIPLALIVINKRLIITICNRKTELIDRLKTGTLKYFDPASYNKSILVFFNRTIGIYLKHLKEIKRQASIIEEDLKKSMKNEELIKLFDLEKDLIQYRTSLKSNHRIIQKLMRISFFKYSEDERDLLEDISIDSKQAIEMADIYSSILNEMMDFFSSLMSNNLNLVMKFLTSITILIAIPTLVSGIYGMNVPLPYQHSNHAFLITILISFVISAMGVILFKIRKWF